MDFFGKGPREGGGSFPIQKITLQIFLVSKRYILVVNFGKNVQKGGRGGVISNPKNFIANLRKLTHIYKFSQKKAQCNFQKWGGRGGVKGRLEVFQKNIQFGESSHPLERENWTFAHAGFCNHWAFYWAIMLARIWCGYEGIMWRKRLLVEEGPGSFGA